MFENHAKSCKLICLPWVKVSDRCYGTVVLKTLINEKFSERELTVSKTECSLHVNCYHFVF